ncbi:hypothetical protein TSAR_002534 [Trichomalopsis sarcophagae]|uniref:Peptidase S1 domain-containing protein n=1 Tax=Trichomalopsis sarcophagae TaxID=543379 RepID=A0A232FL69_9HYME|nr:hypothetical protein TSAR_002534 [Trichomalopsis sarcophagae]
MSRFSSSLEFPYVVSIQSNFHHWCGSALISDQHVLSCAHCWVNEADNSFYDEKLMGPLTIKAGVNDLNDPKYYFEKVVKDIWMKMLTTGPLNDSLFLLFFEQLKTKLDVINSPNVRIVNLPPLNSPDLYVGQYTLVAGYGNTSYLRSPNFYTGTKLNARAFKFGISITLEIKIIILKKSIFILEGGSGSPMVIHNTVIGVVSSISTPCGLENHPTIFTRVSSWINFIEDAMNERYNQDVAVKHFP